MSDYWAEYQRKTADHRDPVELFRLMQDKIRIGPAYGDLGRLAEEYVAAFQAYEMVHYVP